MSRRRREASNETTELWRDVHREQAARRAANRLRRIPEIQALARLGYHVKAISEFAFRIDDALDLYPTRKRYHVLASGERGSYGRERPEVIVRRKIGPARRR